MIGNEKIRNYVGFAIIAILCLGFLYSRALYSIGLLFMGLFWVQDYQKTTWLWKETWFRLLFLIIGIVPIFDLIHGPTLDYHILTKLSLPLFPLFFFTWDPDKENLSFTHGIIFIIFGSASIMTLLNFFSNPNGLKSAYEKAQVWQVGTVSDHIRASSFIAISVLLAIYEFINSKSKFWKWIVMGYALFEVIFLHVLAARTGLVVLYVGLTSLAFHLIFQLRRKYGIAIIIVLLSLPVISFYSFTSFYHRVGFMYYDMNYYKHMNYREGSSDGFRYYSLIAGWDIFRNNLGSGVGFHNLEEVSYKWLKDKFPEIKESELIQPSSEFLIYGASAGLIGFCMFIVYSIFPFVNRNIYQHPISKAMYLGIFFTFLFEIFLESQTGSFVFAFGCFWSWMISKHEFDNELISK